MSSPSEVEFKEFILSDKLSDLENYNADNVLTDELKELYADVQLKCNDFRNNVFFKNVDNIDEELVSYIKFYVFNFQGKLDKKEIPHTYGLGNIDQEVKKIETYQELLAKFEAKANESQNKIKISISL